MGKKNVNDNTEGTICIHLPINSAFRNSFKASSVNMDISSEIFHIENFVSFYLGSV
jgi:hypothetical protein